MMSSQSKGTSAVPRDVVREELNKVLSSEVFQGSERSRTLLRFVVERTLSDQTDGLKEYTLGTEALGKGPAFDPRIDPVVRTEVSRLRTRLDKYYATEGQNDLVVITLLKGSYVPRFERRKIASDSTAGGIAERLRLAFRRRALRAMAASVLVAAIALVSYRELGPLNTPSGPEAERSAATSASGAISIAVLPFLNLSGDAEQEYFSDGMTEEITAALTKIPDLRVVARTSAFQFKGQNQDVRMVGHSLGATHLIEGSVRSAGDRVRITAQLIRADDGSHVWAENYDRELTSVFAIQEDIATAIAGALRTPLGLKQGERLVSNRNIDPETYLQYLRAKALVRARGTRNTLADGTTSLEQVIARDPDYAPAWAQLALAYNLTPAYSAAWVNGSIDELSRVISETLPRAEVDARHAIELDPNLAEGYSSLARAEDPRGRYLQAEEHYLKALALDPNNPDAMASYSLMLAAVGRLKEALAMRQQLQLLDPFVPAFNGNTAVIRWLNGQTDAAIAILNDLPPRDAFRGYYLPRMYAAAGRYSESARALRAAPFAYLPGMREEAMRLLDTAPKPVGSAEKLRRLGNMEFVYLHVGAIDRVLDFYEENLSVGYSLGIATSFLWHPSYAPVRKTERFKTFARKLGLVDYWRVKGWPEFCHPTTGDDFECS